MNGLRGLTYNPRLLKLVRFLRLSGTLRKHYYKVTSASANVSRLNVGGVSARFYAYTPAELRSVEEPCYLWEQDFLNALTSTLRPGDVFYDVGANVGLYAISMAKIVGAGGQVVAFEPETRACARLRENIALNGPVNIRIVRKALGEENAGGRLFLGGPSCHSLLAHNGDQEQQSASEAVEIVQGDALARAEALPIPRAVKIDVEGFEYSVLRGLEQTLANPACKLLCCEIHPTFLPADVTPEMIVAFVKSVGFSRVATEHPRTAQIHMIARKEPAGHGAN